MRSGIVGSTDETYTQNYIFDNTSFNFTGIKSDFSLKVDGSDITGIATFNPFVVLNGIVQQPTGLQPPSLQVGDYRMAENTGVTSITFTGNNGGLPTGYDPNNGEYPIGGLMVSVGSSEGFGYQPLVAAGGTAIVSSAGTITGIGIGNSGSGYRSGIQTTINVSIQTYSTGIPNIEFIGTAAVSGGHIVGVAITNPQVFYVPRNISNVGYTSITGITTITTSTAHGLLSGDEVEVTGIAFTCNYPGSGPVNISNFVYDNVSGIATVTTSTAHNLQTSGQKSHVLFTGIAMTCGLDGGASTHTYPRTTDPYYCGSKVTAVNSGTEFETNVGVSTVPTFYQSGGIAQPVLISPRSTDPVANGTYVLEVIDSTTFVINSGISTRKHFYARCGSVGKTYDVVFDDPLNYENIPLSYAPGYVGSGQSATVDIVVGQGSSVINFTLRDYGFGYGNGERLVFEAGGTTGIPTNTSLTFENFQLLIDEVYYDKFNSWSVGIIEVLDTIENEFDGFKTNFQITLNELPYAIATRSGSLVDVEQTLVVFINDILQLPGLAYKFNGGSIIEFTEAPKVGDTSKILFYKGTGSVDVKFVDILETVKPGDTLDIDNNPELGQGISLDEDVRAVIGINTVDSLFTNPYSGPGITTDPNFLRPVTWCKQLVDKVIDNVVVGKDRTHYEPLIYPASYLTQSVGIGSTIVYVDTVRPLYDADNESAIRYFQNKIEIISQDSIVSASATAIVSSAGTITSISITNSGIGYTLSPQVTISTPVGIGTTQRASATATVSSGSVNSVTVVNPGLGYTTSNPPSVLIEDPRTIREEIGVSSYRGDYGIVVGLGTTDSGSQEQIIFDFFIPEDSFMRNINLVGTAVTISGISTGDYFTIYGTNTSIGNTFGTQRTDGSSIGVGTTALDMVYQAVSVETKELTIPGIGQTYINRVVTNVDSYGVGFAITSLPNLGSYSWGKINLSDRTDQRSFEFYGNNGYTGISTSGFVFRYAALKDDNYT